MATKNEFIGFRADSFEKTKVEQLARLTGMSASDVLRELVKAAEVRPVQRLRPVATLDRVEM